LLSVASDVGTPFGYKIPDFQQCVRQAPTIAHSKKKAVLSVFDHFTVGFDVTCNDECAQSEGLKECDWHALVERRQDKHTRILNEAQCDIVRTHPQHPNATGSIREKALGIRGFLIGSTHT